MATRQIQQNGHCMVHNVVGMAPFYEYDHLSHKPLTAKTVRPSITPKNSNGAAQFDEVFKEARMPKSASTLVGIKRNVDSHLCQEASGAITLPQFVAQHAEHLPLRVKVQSGYYGSNSLFTISAGEVLNVYFKKDTKVVSVKVHNNTFSVPVNSSLLFSLLQPANAPEANKGFVYNSVADLMEAVPRPKVVCCVEDKAGKGLVQEKEILILATDQDSGSRLKVFSTMTRTEKFLPADLPSVFSTHPDLVAMYLTELVSLIPDLFPCSAVIAHNPQVPPALQAVCTLLGTAVKSTLVYSSDSSPLLFDIPLDIPGVEVLVLPTVNEAEMEQLYSSTRDVIRNFNPGDVQMLNDASGSRLDCELQSFFYSNVRAGFESGGVSLYGSSIISSANNNTIILQPPQEGCILHPESLECNTPTLPQVMSSNTTGKGPPILPGSFPRQKTEPSLPDIDDISPSYSTHKPSSSSQQNIGAPSAPPPLVASPQPSSALTIQDEVCLSLQRFASKYSERLPLSIRVQSGSYRSKLVHVSKTDVFTVHFVTSEEVISFKDSMYNTYILPLSATTEFGIACTPGHGETVCSEFETVGDILDSDKLPRVVCARRSFQGSDAKSSVEMNEILIILTAKKMKKLLKAYSITAEIKKYLPAKCKGHFTTSSDATKLSIQKVLAHFADQLPVKMIVHPKNGELPSSLISQQVTVIGRHAKDSLIVSPTGSKSNDDQLLSIPVSAAVEVMVLPPTGRSLTLPRQHRAEQKHRKSEGNAPLVNAPLGNAPLDNAPIGNGLLKASQQQQQGPSSHPPHRRPHLYESLYSMELSTPKTDIAGQPNVTPLFQSQPQLTALPPAMLDRPPHDDCEEIADYAYVECQQRFPASTMASSYPNPPLPLQNVPSSPDAPKAAPQDEYAEKSKKENQSFMASLNKDQVLAVLQGMGLQVYKDKFLEENITGDIFCNLDDEILEKELGVHSRLHRLRLLKIARGETDARQYLL